MLTSLWLPWGDGAAMAPLAFISSVSRIMSAVILVVLTPAVSVGPVAAGWLAYVILLILGGVLAIFLGVLLVKLVELLLRLIAHIPFDETKSTRAGGLSGALRRWDRTATRSLRHGRAAAIAARKHKSFRSKSSPAAPSDKPLSGLATTRSSVFSALNVQVPNQVDKSQKHHHPLGSSSPTPSPAFVTLNDDDGNIMSAMSQGPWLRTPTSETLFTNQLHGLYSNPTSNQPMASDLNAYSTPNVTAPSSGFAVVRGGRASEKAPYLMHNDGRNTWQNSRVQQSSSRNHHDYPPIGSQSQLSTSPDFQIQHSHAGPSFYKPAGNHSNASRARTTNLFETSAFQLGHPEHQSDPSSSKQKAKQAMRKKDFTLLGLFQVGRSKKKGDGSSDDDDDDDWDDSDEEEEEDSSEEEEDGEAGKKKSKLKGILGGLEGWGRRRLDTKDSDGRDDRGGGRGRVDEREEADSIGAGAGGPSTGFQVVRQPRPKPSPGHSTTTKNSNVNHHPEGDQDQVSLPPPPTTTPLEHDPSTPGSIPLAPNLSTDSHASSTSADDQQLFLARGF